MKWYASILAIFVEPIRRWQRNARKREQAVPEYDGRHPSARRDAEPRQTPRADAALALLVIVALCAGCSSTKPKVNPTVQGILNTRIAEIRRQAPLMGIPVELALKKTVSRVNLCDETGRNKDGSYVCETACSRTPDCVHAWWSGVFGGRSSEYMFAVPEITQVTKAHEVHHELLVIFYGIGGHPRRSTVKRLDNGQTLVLDHGRIIGGRWPSAVILNPLLPESWEIGPSWGGDVKCGTEETFEDGGGI